MREVWKELQQRGDEEQPLSRQKTSKNKTGTPKKPQEPDFLDTGFTLRDVSSGAIRTWLALQVVSLVFSLLLWNEVSGHLAEYDETVARECSQPKMAEHGVCHGPAWNMSAWEDFVIGGVASRGRVIPFTTRSNPPTFLVAVDPVSRAADVNAEPQAAPAHLEDQTSDVSDARWTIEVTRVDPPHMGQPLRKTHTGQDVVTFEDFSVEAQETLNKSGKVEWRLSLSTLRYVRKKIRYITFVEDVAVSHLSVVHASPFCSFGRSWKAFNKQHQGHNHRALSWCKFLLGIFPIAGAVAVYLVYVELFARERAIRGNSFVEKHRFHLVVAAKFLVQDVPQQACIVLYIFGWYEASGLRCQLCVFNPGHCAAEEAFHLVNVVALTCTLLSSVANQLLVRPVVKKVYTEDDVCMQYSVRVGGVCIATLPFTTGICLASGSLLPMPVFLHVLFAIPCGLGWLTLACALCFPVIMCCDDDF